MPTSRNSPAASPPDVGVLIPAAGRGERFGGEPKQFREIAGVPMLLRAIRSFGRETDVREIVIALPADTVKQPPAWLAGLVSTGLSLVPGGSTRAESVRAALGALSPHAAIVLVHDAARPFVSPETVRKVIARARSGVGAVAAVRVTDTLKRTDERGERVLETVSRGNLWRAQTPQGFPRAMLEAAYRAASSRPEGLSATDDASLVENAGFPVYLVPDRATNIKITAADDLVFAEALARS